MQEVKNLVIPGIAGILLACAIFSAFAVAPWASTTSNVNFPQMPPGPLDVKLVISNLTEPFGVGSEGILTVIVTSTRNASNVIVQFDLLQVSSKRPMGISFVGENLTTWSGDLRANVSMIFTTRIKAVEVGYAQIVATAKWSPLEGFQYTANDRVWILVQENDIQVSHDPIMITLPDLTVIPGDGTLPQTNATSSIP
jgi:hypothetical protein